jgi:hypothetical protein
MFLGLLKRQKMYVLQEILAVTAVFGGGGGLETNSYVEAMSLVPFSYAVLHYTCIQRNNKNGIL